MFPYYEVIISMILSNCYILFIVIVNHAYIISIYKILRIASALIASIAVNGMHYTGMASATFVYEAGRASKVVMIYWYVYIDITYYTLILHPTTTTLLPYYPTTLLRYPLYIDSDLPDHSSTNRCYVRIFKNIHIVNVIYTFSNYHLIIYTCQY